MVLHIPANIPYLQWSISYTMILIADSGSTKCDWAHLSNDGTVKKFQSAGLNPQVQSEDFIRSILADIHEFEGLSDQVKHLYVYASGCSTPMHKHLLKGLLELHFPDAQMEIENDLFGAARAALGEEEGLIGIIGTGSNLAWFNGDRLDFKTPALGYVMGDEGAGSNIGKKLISRYFYGQMPDELVEAFKLTLPYSKDEVLERVYSHDRPNAFLASVVPFVVEHKAHPFIAKLIKGSFREYVENHIKAYDNPDKVHFVGSVAVHLKEYLREILNEYGIELGQTLSQPIEQLIEYHKSKING